MKIWLQLSEHDKSQLIMAIKLGHEVKAGYISHNPHAPGIELEISDDVKPTWDCPRCSYTNSAFLRSCAVCEADHPDNSVPPGTPDPRD